MTNVIIQHERKWFLDRHLIGVWIVSSIIIIFSFYIQHIEKIEPCSLCKWQRLIYFLIFCASPIGVIRCYNVPIRNLLKILFFIGCCLAFYHISVQLGWINDRCTMSQKVENMNDFMQMLSQTRVACSAIHWKIFGISASIYNGFFSLCGLIFFIFMSNHKDREKCLGKEPLPKNI